MVPRALWAAERGARSAEPVHLSFLTTSACGEPETFWGQVLGLTDRIRPPLPAEPGRHVWVVTSVSPSGELHGELTVRELNGDETERVVDAKRCEELLETLALVVALTVDPDAGTRQRPPPSPPPRPVEPPAAKPPPPRPPSEDAERRDRPLPGRQWRLRVALETGGVRDLAPRVTPLYGARLEVPLFDGSAHRAELRLGARLARSAEFPGAGGVIATEWTAATLGFCALRLTFEPFALLPCVSLDLGVRGARAEGVSGAREAQRASLDSIGSIELSWAAAPWIELRLAGGVRVPWLRYRYVVGPATVFEVPAVGPYLGASLGVPLL
jgi:hypothetical protein